MNRLFLTIGLLAAWASPTLAGTLPGTRPAHLPVYHTQSATALAPIYTASGKVALSVDAIGTSSATGLVRVNKPAGATVRSAWLISASTGFSGYLIPDSVVRINDRPVAWDQVIGNTIYSYNHLADVTAIVKPIVDAAAVGQFDLTITEGPVTAGIDGDILAVVFDAPLVRDNRTAVIFFGAQSIWEDDFVITLAEPARPADPTYKLDLSLGISFGYQEIDDGQVSLIDVNGARMTSMAGGDDDGVPTNGALITVGGIGDTNDNPADPYAAPDNDRSDDELYNLKPFVQTGDQLIRVHTSNPSNDDNMLFAALYTTGIAIAGEGVVLAPETSSGPVRSTHTVTAHVVDTKGGNIPGRLVSFTVILGPNSGTSGRAMTDSLGLCTFSYVGTSAGSDVIHATFIDNSGALQMSNTVERTWTAAVTPLSLTCPTGTGKVGVAYSSSFGITGGTAPYHVTIGAGGLPAGLALDATTGAISGTPTAVGTSSFKTYASDASQQFDSLTCAITIAPADTVPVGALDCSKAGTYPAQLWPPNHEFQQVDLTGLDGAHVTVLSVTQDEALAGSGDNDGGHHGEHSVHEHRGHDARNAVGPHCAQPDPDGRCPDARIDDDGVLWLRSERDDRGNGRVYVVTFLAVDTAGDSCRGTVSVCAPHDPPNARCRQQCVDDGRKYDSFGPCASRGRGDRHDAQGLGTTPDHASLAAVNTPGAPRTLLFGLPVTADVNLSIFDVAGRRVATLVSGTQEAGMHAIDWSATRLERGMYFARLEAAGTVVTATVLVVK